MQLSPLQSRFAASAIATVVLIIIYFTLFPPQFAFAEEISHGSPVILDDSAGLGVADTELETRDLLYEPEFDAFDRSILGEVTKRDTLSLSNNVPNQMNLAAGETLVYLFPGSQLSSTQDVAALELRGEPGDSGEGSGCLCRLVRAGPGLQTGHHRYGLCFGEHVPATHGEFDDIVGAAAIDALRFQLDRQHIPGAVG